MVFGISNGIGGQEHMAPLPDQECEVPHVTLVGLDWNLKETTHSLHRKAATQKKSLGMKTILL